MSSAMTLGRGGVFIGGVAGGRASYSYLVVRSYGLRGRSAVRLPGTISLPLARFSRRELADPIYLFLQENDKNLLAGYESTILALF